MKRMFFKIVKYRFLSSLKHPAVLICMIGAMAFSIFIGVFAQQKNDEPNKYPIAVIDEDGGELAEVFILNISQNKQLQIVMEQRESAVNKVSTGKIDGAFILLDGFSEKIEQGDLEDLVEFISPSVTTSAFPASEIVSAEIVDLWLAQLTENKIKDFYKQYDDAPVMDLEQIMEKMNTDYAGEDIINIEYIGDYEIQDEAAHTPPIDKAVGIFAAFIIFAIMLSSEWVFNFKNKGMQDRLIAKKANLSSVFMGSQAASVLICMLFFIPVIISLALYMKLNPSDAGYILVGMLVYSLGISAISFIVSAISKNLIELIVIGVSVGISNILLSSLVTGNSINNVILQVISKALPGTYLMHCYDNQPEIIYMMLVSAAWIVIGFAVTARINKRRKEV